MSANTVHAAGERGRAYCGRRTTNQTPTWGDVTCADCKAGWNADHPGQKHN